MVDRDKPSKVNLTFSDLDNEVTPTPFVYTTKASKRVTFPDMYDMEAEEGEQFLRDLATKTDGEFLAQWLPAADLAALKADKLSLRRRQKLMRTVLAYYEGSMGDAGEGNASES